LIPLATVKGVSSATAEFQHLLNHPSVLAARGIDLDDAQRYALLREAASGLAFLHKHGVCVGDISPKNLLFSLAPHEAVYFIDCDAMRINGDSALPQVDTPGWGTPSGEERATIYSDTYKLGLLALRLLSGNQDTSNPQRLPATTPTQLRQIITDTLTNEPERRPLPEAWSYVLGHAIEHAQHQREAVSAAEAPVAAALTPPAVPEVRSRPGVQSGPPARPATPVTPTPHSEPPTGAPAAVRSQRWPGLIAAVVVILAVAVVAFEVFKLHSRTSETPTAAPSSQPTVQSASASAPTAEPAPSSAPPPPTPLYFKTQIGRICEVTAQQVTCQSCIPGERITNAYTCADPAPGIAVNSAGTIDDNPAAISSYSDVQQLTVGGTEHANGWTIVSNGAWTRFINDRTGHGMAVAPQNRDSF
jgi:serine/threonine protein kinase